VVFFSLHYPFDEEGQRKEKEERKGEGRRGQEREPLSHKALIPFKRKLLL
jgi:hypothetical protein